MSSPPHTLPSRAVLLTFSKAPKLVMRQKVLLTEKYACLSAGLRSWETLRGLWDSTVGRRSVVLRNGARSFKYRLLGQDLKD